MTETEPKGAPKEEVICLHFSRTSFFWPRGRRETVQNRPRSAPRGPWGFQEASRAAFGGLRASFWSLRGLFLTFLTTFSAPQKSHLVNLILSYLLSLFLPYLIFYLIFLDVRTDARAQMHGGTRRYTSAQERFPFLPLQVCMYVSVCICNVM